MAAGSEEEEEEEEEDEDEEEEEEEEMRCMARRPFSRVGQYCALANTSGRMSPRARPLLRASAATLKHVPFAHSVSSPSTTPRLRLLTVLVLLVVLLVLVLPLFL